ESAINEVLAAEPVWALCPYDTRRLPGAVVTEAMRTHPETTDRPSAQYVPPREFVGVPPDPPPAGATWFLVPSPFDIRRARDAVSEAARATGMTEARVATLTVAVSEAVSNALRHGRTAARVWTWTEPGLALVVQVDDDGRGIADPLAGYRPPSPGGTGAGLWTARQMADVVDVWARPGGGTSVRVAMTA
ncbi:MAG TPA: ATP-binding protein, partial [Actinomycetota bacterium]